MILVLPLFLWWTIWLVQLLSDNRNGSDCIESQSGLFSVLGNSQNPSIKIFFPLLSALLVSWTPHPDQETGTGKDKFGWHTHDPVLSWLGRHPKLRLFLRGTYVGSQTFLCGNTLLHFSGWGCGCSLTAYLYLLPVYTAFQGISIKPCLLRKGFSWHTDI